ncbi:uncharacterized protein Bfra_004868 [Botrytis fragariae]|uniref:Uncharacterized protein n=1 Tax=Botrytis fragariae TaxID=1964551 RepID=A0A8H6EIF0_9HELO|nr:uncharacterized protein Bfra_004868 [Botrytis fragariae]KAF5873408.1 hypothetical protein Bfra_004868 [Botrytis fragariae]
MCQAQPQKLKRSAHQENDVAENSSQGEYRGSERYFARESRGRSQTPEELNVEVYTQKSVKETTVKSFAQDSHGQATEADEEMQSVDALTKRDKRISDLENENTILRSKLCKLSIKNTSFNEQRAMLRNTMMNLREENESLGRMLNQTTPMTSTPVRFGSRPKIYVRNPAACSMGPTQDASKMPMMGESSANKRSYAEFSEPCQDSYTGPRKHFFFPNNNNNNNNKVDSYQRSAVMITYKSRRAEMLERLFVEERENAEYSRALKEAQKEASNFEVVASLPKLEKLKAIESAVYKKLFGDDPSDMKTSLTDEAEEEILELETLPPPASEKKTNIVDAASAEGNAFVESNLSHANQASKPAAPAEVRPLSRLEEIQMRVGTKLKEEMGAAAWQRRKLINAKDVAYEKDRLERINYQAKLIPRKPGGKIHQYTSFAPATYDCRTYWSAEHGSQIRAAQTALHVRFQSVFEKDVEFRLWPEPADWKAFEKNPQKGREILARAEKFLDFWIWDFLSQTHATDRVPLITCLDWFLKGDKSPKYKRYVKLCVTPKPENAVAAKALFQAHTTKVWAKNIDPSTMAQPSIEEVYRKLVDDEGCSKVVSKETTMRNRLGESDSKQEVAKGTIDTSTKDAKKSYPKARQPEFNVLQVSADGTHEVISAKDSRGVTHISQAAADKADEEYAKDCRQLPNASPDGDTVVEAEQDSKDESDSASDSGCPFSNPIETDGLRGRPLGPWSPAIEPRQSFRSSFARRSSNNDDRPVANFTNSPRASHDNLFGDYGRLLAGYSCPRSWADESREPSPVRAVQAAPEVTSFRSVFGFNRPDDVTSGMSSLSLEKTKPRRNSAETFLPPNKEFRCENSG